MEISVVAQRLTDLTGSAIVLPLYEKTHRLPPEVRALPRSMIAAVENVLATGDFDGKSGKTAVVYAPSDSPYRRIILVGLGKKAKLAADLVRRTVGSAVGAARKLKIGDLVLSPLVGPGVDARAFGQAAAEGAELANFRFSDYLTDPDAVKSTVDRLTIACGNQARARAVGAGVGSGQIIGEAVNAARRLVMTPGNVLFPETLAREAAALAKKAGVKAEILEPVQIRKLKMGGVWDVGKGSAHLPRVIVLKYNGNTRKKGVDVCLIGKGVTFDTGGISIKPNERMTEMIGDMMGAATVICATIGAARLRLPVNVVTIVPAVENMPSGLAYRPGDIVTTMSGKTVEIISTDAEGRLILADALHYAASFSPRVMVDIATLTGAAEIALGNQAAALLGNDPALITSLQHAAETTAERVWELPMFEEYAEQLKSDVADMKNSGGKSATVITAAWFLRKFVDDRRWAHLDVAAVDWETKGKPYIPRGATGFGVRLLLQFLKNSR